MSIPSGGWGSFASSFISTSFDRRGFIIDGAIRGMPYAPHSHFTVTVRTPQGIASRALVITLSVSHRSDDLNGTLDHVLHPGQSSLDHGFELGEGLGCLHPIVAYPFEVLGHHVLHHSANEGMDIHRFILDPFTAVRAVMICDPAAVVAVDTPHRDGWCHDVLGEIRGQGVITGRDIALLHLSDEVPGLSQLCATSRQFARTTTGS